jgi:membrane-associated phospholipid phosphatase
VLPIVVGVALYIHRRRDAYHRFTFDIVATFLVSFVGYLLVPAAGPRVPAELQDTVIGGGAASHAIRTFLHAVETNPLDAFPSGHTGVAVVVTWRAFELLRRARWMVAAVAFGIVFSTVYIRAHYVVDVVAGVVLAAFMIFVLGPADRRGAANRGRGVRTVSPLSRGIPGQARSGR